MSTDVRYLARCPACGRPLYPTPGVPPPDRCPECGTALDRPPARDDVIPEAERYVLAPGTTADDGNPYAVFGEKPVPPCPGCDRPLPEDVQTCPRCNYDRLAGRRLPRTYTPLDRTWEAGGPFRWRLAAFLACQALNVVTALMVLWDRGSLPTTAAGWVMMSALQAFVLGTYDAVRLTRTAKGKVTLTKQWRACLIPLAPQAVNWRDHEEVAVRHADVGTIEWLIFLSLSLSGAGPALFALVGSLDVLPAALYLSTGLALGAAFWWFAIRPGRVMVALCVSLGEPVTILYAGTNVDHAREIAETVHDVTGLPYSK